MKILFLVPYPTEGASNRYRVEQFFPYLRERNIEYKLRPFISSAYFKLRYKKGNYFKQILYFSGACLNRFVDVYIRVWYYDIVCIHIEVFPFGPPIFEQFIAAFGKKIVFDFEDAIYLKDGLARHRLVNKLKCPGKFFTIVQLSSRVIVCNNYLKGFISSYNKQIEVIPTSINTSIFIPAQKKNTNDIPVIGWIGSRTTLSCLLAITTVFTKLAGRHKFILKIIGGGGKVEIPGVNIVIEEWSLENEVQNFQSLDIGVYPLPDNEWSLAKTPFKTIQYMAAGIPCVASAVGGNKDIIKDGVNGFLADGKEEWFFKLELLLTDKEIREKIGKEGRKIVEEKFSLEVNAPKFLNALINDET